VIIIEIGTRWHSPVEGFVCKKPKIDCTEAAKVHTSGRFASGTGLTFLAWHCCLDSWGCEALHSSLSVKSSEPAQTRHLQGMFAQLCHVEEIAPTLQNGFLFTCSSSSTKSSKPAQACHHQGMFARLCHVGTSTFEQMSTRSLQSFKLVL
jgi:hypothetical protein